MDEKTGVLCSLIANLHMKTTKESGREWDILKINSQKCVDPCFSFSRGHPESIAQQLKAFVATPKKGYTDYYFVGVDSRGWAILLRLVCTDQGQVNAEIVMLSQRDAGLMSVGYRFEHPEVKGDSHGYFHVQPIRRSASNSELPPSLKWLPDHSPTFFVPAEGWSDLVLYAIHACCGASPIRELWRSQKLKDYTFLEKLAA